jgi:hypothetical protein
MKWYSPVFIIPIVVVSVLSVGWGFYKNKNLHFRKPAPQAVAPIISPYSSSPVPTFFPPPIASTAAINTVSGSKSLFEKYQAASRLSIKRVIATYTNVSLVLGNSS